uniref:Uncharacterized protein n=2 Tax=Meloidogyne incognita TaxID=6306 RepID=A0A914NRL3_MELIC
MVAPTPVSSLVHRRTLVVSGCFLILLGILISLILILFEIDVKKIVAYRTISQVSLIFLFFSYG